MSTSKSKKCPTQQKEQAFPDPHVLVPTAPLTQQQSVILALRTHTGLKQILFHPVEPAHLSPVSLGHIWQSGMSCVQKTRPYGECDY